MADPTVGRPRRLKVVIFQIHAENAGTQEIARLIGAGLAARGYEIRELYFFIRPTSFFRTGAQLILCAPGPPSNASAVVRMAWRAVAAIIREKPDALLCLQWDGNLIGGLVGLIARTPVVIAQQFTAPLMLPSWARWIDRLQGSLGFFSRVIVNTRSIERRYAGYPRRYRNRIAIIEHGFDQKRRSLAPMAARAAFNLPTEGVLLGSVGRLSWQKHFDAAVRLLAENPGWNLALAGQGKEREELVRLAERLGCGERLHLVGEVEPERIGEFLGALDVFVFPARSESFGLAVVEAAQAGVPVVANDLDVLREVLVVEGRPCALFVDVDRPQAFAEAIDRLLRNAQLRQELIDAGRRLGERYGLDRMIDRYDKLLRDLTERETPRRRDIRRRSRSGAAVALEAPDAQEPERDRGG